MQNNKNVGKLMILCLLFMLCGCANIKDPDDYVKSVYPEYEQLAKTEEDGEQIRLLKSQDQYELVRLTKSGFTYTYNGGHKTNAPYGLNTVYTDNDLHITMFIDNTVVKANRFEIVLNSLDQEDITISCPDLLHSDKYIIKSYDVRMDNNEVETSLKFYDKEDHPIPEEKIPFIDGSFIRKPDRSNYYLSGSFSRKKISSTDLCNNCATRIASSSEGS